MVQAGPFCKTVIAFIFVASSSATAGNREDGVPPDRGSEEVGDSGGDSGRQGLRNDSVVNILWTFEDIHMLVGSNMPIFGGGCYTAVSLRLSNKDEELLKTCKNVYFKILSAEKTAPLRRVELFLDLLPQTGSGDLGAGS